VPRESQAVEEGPRAGIGLEAGPGAGKGQGHEEGQGQGPRQEQGQGQEPGEGPGHGQRGAGAEAGVEARGQAGAEAPLALPLSGQAVLGELFRECQSRVGAALQSQQALDDQLGRLAAGTGVPLPIEFQG